VSRGYARYVLAVMVAINFLNYMDRYVGAAIVTPIKTEFQLNDAQIGLLATAFLLVYAIAALPFGYLGDRSVRKTVIGVGVTIWSLATLFSGLAANYVHLFLSRAAVGIGEASYYPAGTSLVSDYFPKEQRGRVMSIWGAGSVIGIAAAYAGGGFVADHYGWRTAFFIAALPGLILAILAFTMREPLRGSMEKVGSAVRRTTDASARTFVNLMRIPTLRAAILSQTVLYFVLASNAFWLPTVLHRRLIGTLAGGWIADRLARTRPAAHLEVGIAGFLIGAVFITIALIAPLNVGPVPVFVPAFLITVIALYLQSGPFTAVSQNVVSPALRASSVTLLLFVSHVFGDSHSTFDVGWISDHVHSIQLALLITSPTLLVVAAIVASTGLRTVKPDTETMEAAWAAKPGEPAPAL